MGKAKKEHGQEILNVVEVDRSKKYVLILAGDDTDVFQAVSETLNTWLESDRPFLLIDNVHFKLVEVEKDKE